MPRQIALNTTNCTFSSGYDKILLGDYAAFCRQNPKYRKWGKYAHVTNYLIKIRGALV